MSHNFRRSGAISRVLCRRLISDTLSRRKSFHALAAPLWRRCSLTSYKNVESRDRVLRWSVLSEATHGMNQMAEFLSFIKSTIGEVEGANHCWLNKMQNDNVTFNKDGVFLVLVNTFIPDSTQFDPRQCVAMIEKLKLLHQRYPKLIILGLQQANSIKSTAIQSQIIQTVMENYVTFPILLSNMEFHEMLNGACYLLFQGSMNQFFHHRPDVELVTIGKDIEEIGGHQKDFDVVHNANPDWAPQQNDAKEPYIYASLRNLFLCYPGGLSADQHCGRLFISDCNHHRIIVTDMDGRILDCIGSSPGFEDGEFESAKLSRPAASFFNSDQNSLYILDSENHALRRADMERRMLETVYPSPVQKATGIWSWILGKLGLQRQSDVKPETVDLDGFAFPWHLMKLGGNDLLIINRSFEMSWIMSMTTGEIKSVTKGAKTIKEMFGDMISDKVSLFKGICSNFLQQRIDHFSLEGIPYASLMSSIANFEDYSVFCDSAGQRILKCHNGESRRLENFLFSNMGILGLPYWLVCPLERVFRSGNSYTWWAEHLHHFNILPGRCDIRVNIKIPTDIELAASLEDSCIWWQVRGSAAELSKLDEADSNNKVGIAQQWYDELDSLAFEYPDEELEEPKDDDKDKSIYNHNQVHFDSAVGVSPGTSEVVVSALLYLKLKRSQDAGEENSNAMRILGMQCNSGQLEDKACVKLLTDNCGDLWDIVFIKPLHLRISLDCGDHPDADIHNKEAVLAETSLEIDVALY